MTETIQWIDPTGVSTTLDVEWDVSSRFAPEPLFQEDETPGQPGGRFRSVKHNVREFTMLVRFQSSTEASLRFQMREVVKKMDPRRGIGKVRVVSPVGDTREINCYVSGGMNLEEKLGSSNGILHQNASIVFKAFDPYWYAPSPVTATYTIGTVNNFFPFFPIRLTASEIVVASNIDNIGDAETWPIWTIKGPGAEIVLHNVTTGRRLSISNTALNVNDYIVIDTTPGAKTVVKQDGTNLWSVIDVNSSMWPLEPGDNAIRLEMSGAVPLVSGLSVSYKLRYLSP